LLLSRVLQLCITPDNTAIAPLCCHSYRLLQQLLWLWGCDPSSTSSLVNTPKSYPSCQAWHTTY
jgi:hypothetical protein